MSSAPTPTIENNDNINPTAPKEMKPYANAVAQISDATREHIAGNEQLREELHAFMREELMQPNSVIAQPGAVFTHMPRIPTELPTKFYPILRLPASQNGVRVFCIQEGETVHLYLLNDPSGQSVYSFCKTELSTPPPAEAR